MTTNSKWRETARTAIARAAADWISQNRLSWVLLDRLDAVQRADLLKAIDRAYPFGTRSHWPYKCWLKGRSEFVATYFYAAHSPADMSPLPLFKS
jgi:hypothetical protein